MQVEIYIRAIASQFCQERRDGVWIKAQMGKEVLSVSAEGQYSKIGLILPTKKF